MSLLSSDSSRLSHRPNRRSSLSHESGDTFSKAPLIRPSTSSHGSGSSDYKILEPGDFRRVRNRLALRPATACCSPLFDSSYTSRSAGSPVESESGFPSWAPISPAKDLVTEGTDYSTPMRNVSEEHDQVWKQGSGTMCAKHILTETSGVEVVQTELSPCSQASPKPPSAVSRHRPYTASSITSTARSSLSSCQDSLESDCRPLMGKPTRRAFLSVHKRPATSGNLIDCPSQEQLQFQLLTRPTLSDQLEVSHALTAEERRQHIRRAKKLAHILGEESRLVVGKDGKSMTATRSLGLSPSLKNSEHAHVTINDGLQTGHTASELTHISRKAAVILGIPHPYSAAARMTTGTPAHQKCSEMTGTDHRGASKLPADTSVLADSSSAPAVGPAMYQTANIGGEHRRRVAKMSRWLGEAVPVELVTLPAPWKASEDDGLDTSDADYHTPWEDVLATHCAQSDRFSNQAYAPYDDHRVSNSSPLESFMSVDSSDSEDETPLPRTRRSSLAPIVTHVADEGVFTSFADDSITPVEAEVVPKDYCPTVSSYTNPVQNACTPLTTLDATREHVPSPSAASAPIPRPSTLDCMPRRSAAFLDLSDTESCASQVYDEATLDDSIFERSPGQTQAFGPASASDRSISKLSNFFGSTPSQIVRSQSNLSGDTYLSSVTPGFSDAPALHSNRTILKSLEDEVMEEGRLNSLQKSDKSRKLRLMKKRTTQLFS